MPGKINGKPYDATAFYWAVMYQPAGKSAKPHICRIYAHGLDAKREVRRILQDPYWEKSRWFVKRFKFYFRGTEIDAYAHEFQRVEKK